MLNRLLVFVGNLVWLAGTLPGLILFVTATRHPLSAQKRVLNRLLKAHRNSAFGRRHDFRTIRDPDDFAGRVPLADYDNLAPSIEAARTGKPYALASEPVLRLEPTSGSSGASRLIPSTASLRREFQAAVDPWIAWLFLAHPRLLLGRHYWAISPGTPPPDLDAATPDAPPVGFADDKDYLGPVARFLAERLLAVPADVRHVRDQRTFVHLTLLFLLRERNLRLVSVWHPSFLTLLLDALPTHMAGILRSLRSGDLDAALPLEPKLLSQLQSRFQSDPHRADELERLALHERPYEVGRAWPHLETISCWTEGCSEPWLSRLRTVFPKADIQGKGLLATEGVVTIPTGRGRLRPCAIRSHFLEFIDPETQVVRRVWELVEGREYSVVLTTGGGFWRYRLHDRVRVRGFCGRTPSLDFLGRDGMVSDLVGEKLHEHHAAAALAEARRTTGAVTEFSLIVPVAPADHLTSDLAAGYDVLLELPPATVNPRPIALAFAAAVEGALCTNYHYAHARRLGQLRPLRPVIIRNGAAHYRAIREAGGAQPAAIKFLALGTATQGARLMACAS